MPHYPGYPPASHVIDYLESYDLPVGRPVHVHSVSHEEGMFYLSTTAGQFTAEHVVAATGTWSAPFVPYYPGTFRGRQWHSSTYPGSEPFRGAKVAVVGGANSGAQIAADLIGTSEVTWFTLEQPRWMPDDVDGRDLFLRIAAEFSVAMPTRTSGTLSHCLIYVSSATPVSSPLPPSSIA